MLAKCKRCPARPSWPGSSGNVRIPGAVCVTRRCLPGGMSLRGDLSSEGAMGRRGTVSGDQAELPGPRGGLGAVSGAELAQDVGHVLFDRVERHDQVVGDALVRLARGEQPQHLQFAAGQRLGQARRRGGGSPRRRGAGLAAGVPEQSSNHLTTTCSPRRCSECDRLVSGSRSPRGVKHRLAAGRHHLGWNTAATGVPLSTHPKRRRMPMTPSRSGVSVPSTSPRTERISAHGRPACTRAPSSAR
jgi:hypothetical protein